MECNSAGASEADTTMPDTENGENTAPDSGATVLVAETVAVGVATSSNTPTLPKMVEVIPCYAVPKYTFEVKTQDPENQPSVLFGETSPHIRTTPPPSKDNRDDTEWGLNYHGRKQFDVGPDKDHMYFRNINDDETAVVKFTAPIKVIVNKKFRMYIKRHIPEPFIRAVYEEDVSIDELLPHELALFQGLLWREIPQAQAPTIFPSGVTDVTNQRVAALYESIANTMYDIDHVFILHPNANPAERKCKNPACKGPPEKRNPPNTQPQIVTLERIMDTITLRPVFGKGFRDGEPLVFKRDWGHQEKIPGLNVRKLSDFKKPDLYFCPECLGWLWNRRVKVWANVAAASRAQFDMASEAAGPQGMPPSDGNPRFGDNQPSGECQRSGENQHPGENHPSAYNQPSSHKEPNGYGQPIGYQMDGFVDPRESPDRIVRSSGGFKSCVPTILSVSYAPSGEKIFTSVNNVGHEHRGEKTGPRTVFTPVNNVGRQATFGTTRSRIQKLPPAHQPGTNTPTKSNIENPTMTSFSAWHAINAKPTAPSGANDDTMSDIDDLLDLQASLQPGVDIPFKGTFDSPPTSSLYEGLESTRPTGRPVKLEYKGFKFPVPPFENTGPIFPIKQFPSQFLESRERKLDIIGSAERAAVKPSTAARGAKIQVNASDVPSRIKVQSQFHFTLNGHRRGGSDSSNTETSDSLDLVLHPTESPTRKGMPPAHLINKVVLPPAYCYCRRDDDGSKMVECKNPNCEISWFHYDCLNKSQKLSSRGKNWICSDCKDTKSVTSTQVSDVSEPDSGPDTRPSFEYPFSDAEIVNFLHGVSSTGVVNNPYRLASIPPYPSMLVMQQTVRGNTDSPNSYDSVSNSGYDASFEESFEEYEEEHEVSFEEDDVMEVDEAECDENDMMEE